MMRWPSAAPVYLLLCWTAFGLLGSTALAGSPREVSFDYVGASALQMELSPIRESAAVEVSKLKYLGAEGSWVEGLLVRRRGVLNPATVVFQHQLGADAEQFEAEAVALARQCGWASILVAAPFSRSPAARLGFDATVPGRDAELQRKAVVDLRRAIDVALAQGFDASRVGYVGHSYGANWGGVLSAVEPRYRALVLIAGVGSVTAGMHDKNPEWDATRNLLGPEGFARYRQSLEALDPEPYVRRAKPRALMFQFGTRDSFTPRPDAERFASSAPAAEVRWYDADHNMDSAAARVDRRGFLSERLDSPCAQVQ